MKAVGICEVTQGLIGSGMDDDRDVVGNASWLLC